METQEEAVRGRAAEKKVKLKNPEVIPLVSKH